MIQQKFKCPNCGQINSFYGDSGETKIVSCVTCNSKDRITIVNGRPNNNYAIEVSHLKKVYSHAAGHSDLHCLSVEWPGVGRGPSTGRKPAALGGTSQGVLVEENGIMYIFNYVMGDWTIEVSPVPFERIKHKNIVVLIGPPECVDGIAKAAQSGKWSSRGVYQPYSQS